MNLLMTAADYELGTGGVGSPTLVTIQFIREKKQYFIQRHFRVVNGNYRVIANLNFSGWTKKAGFYLPKKLFLTTVDSGRATRHRLVEIWLKGADCPGPQM